MLKKVLVDCNVIIPSPPLGDLTSRAGPIGGSNYGEGSSHERGQSRRNLLS